MGIVQRTTLLFPSGLNDGGGELFGENVGIVECNRRQHFNQAFKRMCVTSIAALVS